MWRGQHNGHWDISRRLLEKEVFWPWSRSPGAPGAGSWRKRRGPSRSSSSSIPFICLQSVSNPRTGGCTWESDLDYILSRSYRWTLDQRKSYCLELITSLLFSWAVKIYHILPPKIVGSLRLRKLPLGFNYCFPGKDYEHSKAEDSGNYISVSHSPETCNLSLSFASFLFCFTSLWYLWTWT